MGYALTAQFLSDRAETALGYAPTEQDTQRLQDAMPRLRTVERNVETRSER